MTIQLTPDERRFLDALLHSALVKDAIQTPATGYAVRQAYKSVVEKLRGQVVEADVVEEQDA